MTGCGKRAFLHESLAITVAADAERNGLKYRAYKCPHCEMFHLATVLDAKGRKRRRTGRKPGASKRDFVLPEVREAKMYGGIDEEADE